MNKIGKNLYKWIKTFIAIILVMILLLLILINWMLQTFTEEIKDLNYGLTSIVQKNIDIRLNDIRDFMTQLELNNTNIELSNYSRNDFIHEKNVYSYKKQLSDFKLSNTYVESILVYYPKLDYIIGDMGDFQSKQYYLLMNDLNADGYTSWLRTIAIQNNGDSFFYESSSNQLDLYFTKQLIDGSSGDKKSILLVKIKKEEVFKTLSDSEFAVHNSMTAILNDENQRYVFYGNEQYLDLIDVLFSKAYPEKMVHIGKYLGSTQVSDFSEIRYVTIMNQKAILQSIYSIRNIAYISLLLCMIFGISIFVVMGKRNTRPVTNLVKKFQVNSQENGREFLDEYSFINKKIDNILADQEKSIEKLDEQRGIIEGLFLSNLLSSEEHSNSVIFASVSRYNIQFEYSMFQIVLIRNNNCFQQKEINLVTNWIITYISQEKLDLYVIATEYLGDIVLLFNMEQDIIEDKVITLLRKLHQEIRGKACIVLGGNYDSMSQIVTSYHQARNRVDCEENLLHEEVILANEKDARPSGYIKEASSIMAEYELHMLEGNYEEAQRKIDVLFNQYIAQDTYAFTSRCKKYAVINPIIEAVIKATEKNPNFPKEYYYGQLSLRKDNQELLKILHTIFNDLIVYLNESQLQQNVSIAENAKELIHHHFEDPMLGLYLLSEHLNVSNTYLSTVFKKTYHIGITQYINQLRIDKAKKLIINSDYNVKEIATKVGFSSDVTFIRVFKKFENITPGKFK